MQDSWVSKYTHRDVIGFLFYAIHLSIIINWIIKILVIELLKY